MRHDGTRFQPWVGRAALAAALLGWPWVTGTPYLLSLATGAAVWALFATSYDLVIGWAGEVSFGHALYFGLGVYGTALLALHTHWPTLLTWTAVALGVLPLAFLLNVLGLRVTGPYFAMITFALAEFAHLVVQNASSVTGGENGLVGIPLSPWVENPGFLYDAVATLSLGAVVLVVMLKRSRLGRLVHAVRDNPVRAELLGYPVGLVKALTLTAAAGLAALAGATYVADQGMAFADVFSSDMSFTVLLMVIIGGVDSGWGPAVAGAGLALLETLLNAATVHWGLLLGAVYVAVVRFAPQGVGGFLRRPRPTTTGVPPASALPAVGEGGRDV